MTLQQVKLVTLKPNTEIAFEGKEEAILKELARFNTLGNLAIEPLGDFASRLVNTADAIVLGDPANVPLGIIQVANSSLRAYQAVFNQRTSEVLAFPVLTKEEEERQAGLLAGMRLYAPTCILVDTLEGVQEEEDRPSSSNSTKLRSYLLNPQKVAINYRRELESGVSVWTNDSNTVLIQKVEMPHNIFNLIKDGKYDLFKGEDYAILFVGKRNASVATIGNVIHLLQEGGYELRDNVVLDERSNEVAPIGGCTLKPLGEEAGDFRWDNVGEELGGDECLLTHEEEQAVLEAVKNSKNYLLAKKKAGAVLTKDERKRVDVYEEVAERISNLKQVQD